MPEISSNSPFLSQFSGSKDEDKILISLISMNNKLDYAFELSAELRHFFYTPTMQRTFY